MKRKAYVGNEGTEIILNTYEDLTGATVGISVQKPSGVTVVWSATVYETQKVRYTVQAGDFNEVGVYNVQPVLALPDGGWSGLATSGEFRVYGPHQ